MIDTQTVLWIIPPVLIAVALRAKLLVHRAKPSTKGQPSHPNRV